MRHLVFAHRNEIAFVDQDVRRLQHRVAEKSVSAEIFFRNVLALLLVGGDALQPAQRRDHGKQQMQFGMLRHVRLDEHGAALGIEPGGQPVEQHFQRVFFDPRSVGVIGGERVPVGDEEKAIVLVLHAHPVVQRADEVSQMQLAGGAHTAEHAFALV